jgi:hypothetical protein
MSLFTLKIVIQCSWEHENGIFAILTTVSLKISFLIVCDAVYSTGNLPTQLFTFQYVSSLKAKV